jgi:hypothetical protein
MPLSNQPKVLMIPKAGVRSFGRLQCADCFLSGESRIASFSEERASCVKLESLDRKRCDILDEVSKNRIGLIKQAGQVLLRHEQGKV